LTAPKYHGSSEARDGGARECLHDWPVRQDIRVDFMLGAIDKRNVDVFKGFRGRIVNDRRGIGAARRDRGEKENCGYGSAQRAQTD